MMKSITKGTSLVKSVSQTTVPEKQLKAVEKANLERSEIAKVTGHRNLQSLDDYDKADEQEKRHLS